MAAAFVQMLREIHKHGANQQREKASQGAALAKECGKDVNAEKIHAQSLPQHGEERHHQNRDKPIDEHLKFGEFEPSLNEG